MACIDSRKPFLDFANFLMHLRETIAGPRVQRKDNVSGTEVPKCRALRERTSASRRATTGHFILPNGFSVLLKTPDSGPQDQDQVIADPYWAGFLAEYAKDPNQTHLYDNFVNTRVMKSPSLAEIRGPRLSPRSRWRQTFRVLAMTWVGTSCVDFSRLNTNKTREFAGLKKALEK